MNFMPKPALSRKKSLWLPVSRGPILFGIIFLPVRSLPQPRLALMRRITRRKLSRRHLLLRGPLSGGRSWKRS